MVSVTTRRKKKNKAASITAETAERIAAAALENPSFGPDRLAQLLRREGVDVSRSMVYRKLRDRGLQTRALRARFLDEQGRLKEQVDSREPKKAPVPPSKHFHEQPRESPGPPVSIPGIEYDTPPVSAPAEDKPEPPAGVVPTRVDAPAVAHGKAEKAHSEKEKWLFRGINLLLAVFLVFLGIRIGGMLYYEWQEPIEAVMPSSAPEPSAKAVETAEPDTPLSDYRVILDRNLFGSANQSVSDPARETLNMKEIGIAGSEVGLKLIGTSASTNRRLNYAVVEVTKNRHQEIVSEGNTVAAVLIKRIFRNNVIIQTTSGEKRLTIDEKPSAGFSAPLVQPAAVGVNVPVASQADGGNKGITIEIPRSDVTQALPEIRQRLEGPNRSTNRPAGRPDGFYLSRVVAVDVLYRIGLRTGDVIKSVDGAAVESLDDAEVLLDRLAEGGEFPILVERGGQLQSLNLSVN
jgi:type II secretory pathway component PulC